MNIDKSKLSTGPCASGNGELKTDISKLPLNTDEHLSAKKRMSAIPQKEYDWEIPGTVDPFRGQDIKERFYSHVTNIRIMHRSFKPFCPSGELSPEQAVRLDGAAQLIGKYKSADDRRRSALGYLGLEYCLNDMHLDLNGISLRASECGKPYLWCGNDSTPDFSISHSGPFSVCVADWSSPVGVDIEAIRRDPEDLDARMRIAKRFFPEHEYEYILRSKDRAGAFTVVWTAHEAVGKFAGCGFLKDDAIRVATKLNAKVTYFALEMTENGFVICDRKIRKADYILAICTGISGIFHLETGTDGWKKEVAATYLSSETAEGDGNE